MLNKITFRKFTAFEELTLNFSHGINVFIGENGTGKTHVLKTLYSSCEFSMADGGFAQKINNVFSPSGKQIGRLVKRAVGRQTGTVEIRRAEEEMRRPLSLKLSVSSNFKLPRQATAMGEQRWSEQPPSAVYIPVKDMLANSKGFGSLYEAREISFEEVYVDIIRKALLPPLKGPTDSLRRTLLKKIKDVIDGTVGVRDEEFFLYRPGGNLEFALLAEGYRKLGLLMVLIQNGTLSRGSALFWDEPEANLNPKLMRCVIEILLELQRSGVQIFLATHNYVLLKELDLQATNENDILYHSLFVGDSGEIAASSTVDYMEIDPNPIDETFDDLLERDIDRSIEGSA